MKYLIILILTINAAQADSVKPSIETIAAILHASKMHKIDAQALIKIAFIESRFKNDAVRLNKNKTVDVGMFQINSVNWVKCQAYNILTIQGNALCAAKLLASHAKHGKHDKHWIGRYHSKTHAKKLSYVKLLASVKTKKGSYEL